ncbi:hypothetical protein HYU20_00340 [Candidatus Woesearchaeota archaeon]|nr:hypothetical protein [Candidatus Woesearchaeota archaeon]
MKPFLAKFLVISVLVIALLVGFSAAASAQYCGDSFCDPGEEGWCSDCDVPSGYCGDGFCDPGEEGWCSDCSAKPFCGDSFCDFGESFASCPNDCGCPEKLLDNYRCSGNDREREKVTADCVTKQWFKAETCQYGCNPATATCNPKPSCEEKFIDSYRCSGDNRQREKQLSDCSGQWVTLDTCAYGCQQVWASPTLPVSCNSPPDGCAPAVSCATLGCGNTDSCGTFCGSCPPPAVVDNAPTATINVPSSASPGSQLSILVTGNDDKDVSQLLLYDGSNNLLATFDCAGVQTSCSHTFTRTAPATFSTSYTFKSRSKDSANQLSDFFSGTGTTTAAPAPPPVSISAQLISQPSARLLVRFPLQPLFLRSVSFPDSDCVRPGESALLAVKVQNSGRSTLKDVSFTATVPELGIRARTGPHSITRTDRSAKFMQLDVPADAEEGSYFLRLSVTNNKFARVVHRAFTVDSGC